MLFSSDRTKTARSADEPKRQSMAGFLFNPRIGDSIRPIGESHQMFLRIIAWIFAANKLFPRNHPALLGNMAVRLSMREIIATAWADLQFTKEGLPRVILFTAVVGTMVIAGLTVVTFFASLFMGSSHAAAMFDKASDNDIAYNWLGYLFLGKSIPDLGSGQPMPQAQNIQTALKTAMGFYSKAILVFAGVILLYHLIAMVAETAHSGTPMGKSANQIWAPIRLVFAIGLLVPVGTLGLNTAQYVMVQMAEWGSGLGSQTWKMFLNTIAADKQTWVGPPSPQIETIAKNMVLMQACMIAYNHFLGDSATGPADLSTVWADWSINKYSPPDNNQTTTIFGNSTTYGRNICGGYSFVKSKTGGVTANNLLTTGNTLNPVAQDYTTKIFQIHQDALNGVQGQIAALAAQVSNFYPGGNPAVAPGTANPNNGDYTKLVTQYHTDLQTKISALFAIPPGDSIQNLATQWSATGWASAGAWFNTIARTQGGLASAAKDGMPITFAPPLLSGDRPNQQTYESQTAEALRHFSNWLDEGYSKATITTPLNTTLMTSDAKAGLPLQGGSSGLLDTILGVANTIGTDNGFFSSVGSINYAVGTSANPLAELAMRGHQNLLMAFDLVEAGAKMAEYARLANTIISIPLANEKDRLDAQQAITPKLSASENWLKARLKIYGAALGTVKELGDATLTLAITFASLLFTVGLMLAFIIPLLPYTLFFFNTLTWVVSVFEAVISMPLFALAHLTTKGEGLPGGQAQGAYFFIFSIFLRPVLMIFGLMAGLLIFFIAISFLNMTWEIASAGAGNFGTPGGGFYTLSQLIFNVLYGMFAYICANTAFKTIGFFPEHAMSWMGARGPQVERMGDKQLMNAATSAITAYGFQQAIGGTVGKFPVLTDLAERATGNRGDGFSSSLQLPKSENSRGQSSTSQPGPKGLPGFTASPNGGNQSRSLGDMAENILPGASQGGAHPHGLPAGNLDGGTSPSQRHDTNPPVPGNSQRPDTKFALGIHPDPDADAATKDAPKKET